MIDLVSTRNVDHQTKACARLLGAVISQAVMDAATPFTAVRIKEKLINETRARKNLVPTARSAIRWLFFPDSVFPAYASLIGLDAKAIRENLLSHRYEDNKLLTPEQRRIIRIRLEFEENTEGVFEESDYADDVGVQQETEGPRSVESPGKRGADMEPKGVRNRAKVSKGLRE